MPPKKDNLPINLDVDPENGGTITYANEVIAIIAGVAANEVEGIAGMCTSGGIADIIGRNRNITRGVKVEIGGEEASVDLYIIVEYGSPIQKVASEVQENVRKAIDTMTGLRVVRVDVHVQGVSFEKDKKALQSGIESAHIDLDGTHTETKAGAVPEQAAAAVSEEPAETASRTASEIQSDEKENSESVQTEKDESADTGSASECAEDEPLPDELSNAYYEQADSSDIRESEETSEKEADKPEELKEALAADGSKNNPSDTERSPDTCSPAEDEQLAEGGNPTADDPDGSSRLPV